MTDIAAAIKYIQAQAVVANKPPSEWLLSSMGASINAALQIVLPVGSIVQSMLTEAQFQDQIGNLFAPFVWILADGRGIAGSTFANVTGITVCPDMRSVILRGRDNGRGLNPSGNLALGTYTADKYDTHNHALTDPGHNHAVTDPTHTHSILITTAPLIPAFLRQQPYKAATPGSPFALSAVDGTGTYPMVAQSALTSISPNAAGTNDTINLSGGNETAPKTVTLNTFLRIN